MLVDTLIDCEWLLRRFRRVEAEIWQEGMRNQVHCTILGESFDRMEETFARLQRRVDATQRNYRNALHELQRLQAEQAQLESEPATDPEPVSPPPQTTNPANGFVPREPLASPISPAEPVPNPRREPLLP
jgi:hypothetical protein